MPEVLNARDDERLEHEITLRRSGFVPLTAYDAPYPSFAQLLPACRVRQVVPHREHGRVVWSHPGRSGLDPRAVAPLAIVRVADGLGPDPLDPPIDLVGAARELLDGEVDAWVRRRRHRVLVRTDETTCLYEAAPAGRRCRTHCAPDPLLQAAADALGDPTYAACRPRQWPGPHCTTWGPAETRHDLTGLARCALDATLRLGAWLDRGLTGSAAWDLARSGVTEVELAQWHAAGFATEDVPVWRVVGRPGAAARTRDRGDSPYRSIELPPVPPADPGRGLGGFARWKISIHQRERFLRLVSCQLCGARDDYTPCRTCRAEKRTVRLTGEWADHVGLVTLDAAYAEVESVGPVDCGVQNCRTALSPSAADEGARA